MFSVVIATADVVGERMAGPGIRAWHFATELGKHFPTTLIARFEHASPAPFPMAEWSSRDARTAMREAAVLIGQPARGFRKVRAGQRIVYDLFDPVLLELREMYGGHPSPRQRIHFAAEQWRLRHALAEGDLLIVAAPNQRELYESARDRLIEVPFGAEEAAEGGGPTQERAEEAAEGGGTTQERAEEAAVGGGTTQEREDLIVWGGGTWEWLDPRTAVDAVVRLNLDGVPCRLLFLGRARPNRNLVDRRRENRFDQLLAAGQPYVTANEEWVPYRERLSWLSRSKIAIMLHRSTAEARYSIRTRLFDAIAAATPVIVTEEGFAAELVAQHGLGIVVPPSDVGAVAGAMRRLLHDDAFHASCVSNLERIRPQFAWPAVVRPLVEAVSRWKKQV